MVSYISTNYDLNAQNIRAMLHDPEMYPDPETFNPERFLKDGVLATDVMDPSTVVFGFGRRYDARRNSY